MNSISPGNISGPTLPAAATRELLDPGRVVGRFRIRKLAGMGGMGEVYQAWDPLLERYVALKAVRPSLDAPEENLERFRREALALAQLSHPHVCQVHDLVTSELGTFIAMEWLEGETLDQATRRLNQHARLLLTQETAEGLAAAHAKGLVHRDLKPSNVMVSEAGHAKILDFGLARHLDGSSEPAHPYTSAEVVLEDGPTGISQALGKISSGSSRFSDPLTQQGVFMGSPRYASPEQIEGHAIGAPSDVFALGVMLWELLTNEHPFPGEGRDRFKAVVANRRRPLKAKRVSRRCAALLDGMLAPKPEDRLPAAQVAQELQIILRPLGRGGVITLTVVTTLLAAALTYFLLGRGVVIDLVNKRSASVAVMPVVNRTGDSSIQAELRWVLPDLVGSGLRTSPRLRVVPMEAVAKLNWPQDKEVTGEDAKKIHRTLGTNLCLASELRKDPSGGWILTFRLLDQEGHSRYEGHSSEATSNKFGLQTLSRKTAVDLLHAVDPFGKRPEGEAMIPPMAFQAYATGREFMSHGDFKAAREPLKVASEMAPLLSDAPVQYGICLQKIGDNSCDMAIQWGRWSAHSAGNRRNEIQAITQLGLLRMEQGRWEESQAAFDEALTLADALGDEDFQSALFNNLGFLAMERKQPQVAERFLSQALMIERRLGQKAEEALTLNNLAVLAKDRGDFQIAEQNYQRVLESVRESGDRWAESIALNNLGDVAIGKGDFLKAENFFRESLRLKREIGHHAGTVIPLTNLGILGRLQTNWASGRTFLEEALALCLELHKLPMAATVRFQLGCLELAAGRPVIAMKHFQASAAMHLRLQNKAELAQDLAGQCEALLDSRSSDRQRMTTLLHQARENDAENPFVLRAEARDLAARGQQEEARRRMQQALTWAQKLAPEEVPGIQQRLREI